MCAHGIRMFTQTLKPRVLGCDLVNLLTGPHGVDRYTEQVDRTWTLAEGRAKVVDVRRDTPRSVTLVLAPNEAFTDTIKAGQYVNLSVEIDGRRHTRCYSPANAEGSSQVELTIGHHDGGLVSTYMCARARRGMVVGLPGEGGTCDLPARRAGGRVTFANGSMEVADDGRRLLERAEQAGRSREGGCRMGICHPGTRRKTSGVVRNLTPGAVSTAPDEDVQICVSVPVGDVDIAL